MIEKVIKYKYDHSNLNLDKDLILPTTKNIIFLIWYHLESYIKGCNIHGIQLRETDCIFVEYFGKK